MSWIAAAVIGGSVIGGVVQSRSASKAADAQRAGADQASATQLEMFYQSREDTAPWREAGERALNLLAPKIEAGPGEFKPGEDPGYQFGYEQFVEKPLLRNASAQGSLGGGRSLKELTRYASDYASTKYDNFLSRWYQSLNPLQSMAGIGQTTATQNAQNALATGQSIGQNQIAAGNARATGYVNQGNIWGNTASGLVQNALDYYYMNKYNTTPKINYGSDYGGIGGR